MLQVIATPILSITASLLGSGLDHFLLRSLFKVQKRMDNTHTVADHIKRRKPFEAQICNWLCNRRNRRLEQHSSDLLGDELDIANFLRHQLVSKLSLKVLFNKVERRLLYNQADPFVVSDKRKHKFTDNLEGSSS